MSKFDHLYRSLLLTNFFTRGWGKPDNLKKLFNFRKIVSNRETCQNLVPKDYPIYIDKDETCKEYRLLEGHFLSPFVCHLPGIMPKEVETARFQMILPNHWKGGLRPVCIQLAGTGDHGFGRRRKLLALPLIKEAGIASILLENPYYGCRKPKQQKRSSLLYVSDLFVMGAGLILESQALLHWCEREGYGPLGISGVSMGGHMASLAATNWPSPLSLIPILSWSTASTVFTQGVLSQSIPWNLLQEQYATDTVYEQEINPLIYSPEEGTESRAFVLGQTLARNFPKSVNQMEDFQDENYTGVYDNLKEKTFVSEYLDNCQNPAAKPTPKSIDTNTNYPLHTSIQYLNFMATVGLFVGDKIHETFNSSIEKIRQLTYMKNRSLHNEALYFMRGVMDECTHLGNFSVPVDTSLIIIIGAKKDGYVPRDSVLSLEDLWPGAEVRYINTGHIVGFLFNQKVFRKAIIDSFERQITKHYSSKMRIS